MFKKVPRNVFLLGLVSFFNDVASEMIYPIVPIFLTSVLGTPIPILGIIEGIAESTASITKFLFGAYSDYVKRRKVFVILGYSFGAISKILIGLATGWPLVLFARFIDRTGKGLRTAPRDSLLLQNATPQNKGFIFGFHRSLDSFGAVIGPLLALVLLALLHENMRLTFLIAFIPAFIGVLLLIFFVKEKKTEEVKSEIKPKFFNINWKTISPNLKVFLLVNFLFAVGNSSDAFLILNAKNIGFSTTLTVLAYVLYNVVQTIFATPAGQWADKIGARKVFTIGLLIFAVVYFLFGINKNPLWIWFLFPVYGLYIAFTDGVSKAYVAEFTHEKTSGSYFGLHQTIVSFGNFFASFIGGVLWAKFSPSITFLYGSLMALIAFMVFFVFSSFSKKLYES